MGYLTEADCQSNLKTIFEKLPTRIQARWVEHCCSVEQKGQRPSFRKMVDFIQLQASKSNHPIFKIGGDTSIGYGHQRKVGRGHEMTMATREEDGQGSQHSAMSHRARFTKGSQNSGSESKGQSASQPYHFHNTDICAWCTRNHHVVECPIFYLKPAEE
jgi:hypothetical protein